MALDLEATEQKKPKSPALNIIMKPSRKENANVIGEPPNTFILSNSADCRIPILDFTAVQLHYVKEYIIHHL